MIYQGGNWSYLHLGEKVKGWKNIDGDWYFFGTDGVTYSFASSGAWIH